MEDSNKFPKIWYIIKCEEIGNIKTELMREHSLLYSWIGLVQTENGDKVVINSIVIKDKKNPINTFTFMTKNRKQEELDEGEMILKPYLFEYITKDKSYESQIKLIKE